jgi:hypothetical protein
VANRVITFTEWHRQLRKSVFDSNSNVFENVAGVPASNAAKKLQVSEQRVNELIRQGVLDTVQVSNAAGRICLTMVTDASLDRYLAHRVPDRGRQGYFAFPA